MGKINQKAELVANIFIIVFVIVIGGVLVQQHFFRVPVNQQRIELKVGAKIPVPNVDWAQQTKTLILALNIKCRFCSESSPFYKRIIETTRDKNIKLIAVFPSSVEENAIYLKSLGLANVEVRQSPLESLQVSGTPTIILTNEKGEITDYWVGKLPSNKETEVISKLNL